MELIQKQKHHTHHTQTYLAYNNIEPEFIATKPRTRVLPAPFFYEKKIYFEVIKRYEPGEKRSFPNGGYELRDINGGVRNYDLDQVIIHPAVIKHKKMLEKMHRRVEKIKIQKQKEEKRAERRRGRPKSEPKPIKEKSPNATGRRGRPKSLIPPTPKQYIKTGGKRGRPSLPMEEIERRKIEQQKRALKSGGKRGRPKRS